MNATLVTLISKIPLPNKVILINIIKGGLNKLVNYNQNAFVPGRVIQDNLLITQELLKGYQIALVDVHLRLT